MHYVATEPPRWAGSVKRLDKVVSFNILKSGAPLWALLYRSYRVETTQKRHFFQFPRACMHDHVHEAIARPHGKCGGV
jgi:hypothetical protein